jgi:DNA invertase Pin-like site-specific DNA recombinase
MDQMIQIDEGRMKDIFTADQEGQSAEEIAKALKLPLGTVKKILGEDNDLQEFSDSQLDVLARQYAGLKGKTISVDNANKLRQIFKRIPDSAMDALRKKKIPFLSGLALSRMVQKGMPVKEDKEEPKLEPGKDGNVGPAGKIALAKEKDTDALEAQLVTAKGQIELLKTKLENEKNKAVKPEPNKETGEVPLTVGVAHKYLKAKAEKDKEEVKKEETIIEFKKMTVSFKTHDMMSKASTDLAKQGFTISGNQKALKVDGKGADLNKYATDLKNNYGATVVAEAQTAFTSQQIKQAYGIANDPRYKGGDYSGAVKAIEKLAKGLSTHPDVMKVLKKTNEDVHAGAKLVYEQIKGLKNKAEKTGMPYGVLKKVYDRGMAAWRGGHRPGTTQQQWAFARVNSFVTKSSGTWGGADKDLAKQVTGKN